MQTEKIPQRLFAAAATVENNREEATEKLNLCVTLT
jgi:hypothetical protein